MLPPPEVAANIVSTEKPPDHPKGPNTNFQFPTPMPFRYSEGALPAHNQRFVGQKKEHPIYSTTTSDIGKMPIQMTDYPMRWYGTEGGFTGGWVAPPKTLGNASLTTAIDRSNIHPTYDQGWSGHLGPNDFNVPNRHYATFVGKAPRKADH